MAKQTIYNAGIYVRLSQEDMRAGESLSIENQKLILTKYVKEQGWNLIDIYVDDGYSGTNFDRPGVQRLLDDAKNGVINLIICKDLSRFGRNYIQVGQYTDYIFPTYNIRFIALNDNVDTANKDSSALDMMPIVNLFNEWHSASTSKKIKAVIEANAKAGKYRVCMPPYGYVKSDTENKLPIPDEPAASVVRRIFELRAKGISPRHICDILNDEHILPPSDYAAEHNRTTTTRSSSHLWCGSQIRKILHNPTYLGHLVQLRSTTVSYKNHKKINKSEEDMVIIKNTHEPLVSQELWDKVLEMEASVSQGKKTKTGITDPLSGLMFCQDCGNKMRLMYNNTTNGSKKVPRIYTRHNYNCGAYNRFGKRFCNSHYIKRKDMNAVILADIKMRSRLVIEDEEAARAYFMAQKEQYNAEQYEADTKHLNAANKRLAELAKLIPSIYEDKVIGKIPEDVCVSLLEKYQTEQKALTEEVEQIEEKLSAAKQDQQDVDEYIYRLKKYADVPEITREMALELIEYITVDEYAADRPRDIHIYYKLLDKPLPNKTRLEVETPIRR
ncbi:MAG: recombinase family protein [Ruminococcus sp.]|nr:recombinase family protein [Ruminococcus sp.]